VVLIRDRHIALIERIRPGRHYWVLPGGGIEAGESGAEAAIREAFEELGIEVAIVAHLDGAPSAECFLAECADREFGPVSGPETQSDPDDRHIARWVGLSELGTLELVPAELKAWLLRSFPPPP
jgi:8-oxo-dGTP diphosphatase